ncbi:MAG TPA: hypothetical protein VGB17_16870 [Pyrinomonadaceae bacterium]|jgi:hypothetical protein
MKYLRPILVFLLLLLLFAAAWLYWWRPVRVDMAAYVPADAVLYLEANNLPDLITGMTRTDGWKKLGPAAGINPDAGRIDWLSRLAARTGIGPAETVVLSRAQVAVVMLGIETGRDGEDTLKIKPRIAIVVETHTGERRTEAAVEKLVGSFARRAYGEPLIKREESEGAKLMTWTAPGGSRQIVAAVMGSLAVIGNDEEAVRACLQVRRSQRPGLAGNPQLEQMRARVSGSDAIAFGYISPKGATRLLEVIAPLYASQISDNPHAQSVAASFLLPMANKVLGSVGWSSRFTGGGVEDHYFVALQNGLADQLREPLALASTSTTTKTGELLPASIYSLSRYNSREPAEAWRGLKTTLLSQADAMAAVLISTFFDELLKPYGVEEPASFLRAIGPEIVTARLDDTGSSTVTIVEVRDEKALRDFVSKRIGPNARSERLGEIEMLVSREEKRGAVAFLAGHLLMGSEASVRRCLEARAQNKTLAVDQTFQQAARSATGDSPASVLTYTDDEQAALKFISSIMAQRGARGGPANYSEMERALTGLPYAVSETRLAEGGFERKTHSTFGQLGALAAQFTPAR